MIIRNLDSNGDITFGSGTQNYLTGQQAIALNIKTRILSFLNNCVWDMASGIDWFSFLTTPANAVQLQLVIKATILQSNGVISVNDVSISQNGRQVNLTYSVNTIYTTNFTAVINNINSIITTA